MKRLLEIVLIAALLLAASTKAAYSDSIFTSVGNDYEQNYASQVTLTVNARTLSVTVPSVLPCYIDSNSSIYLASNAGITNNQNNSVSVKSVTIVSQETNYYIIDREKLKTNICNPITDEKVIGGKSALQLNYSVDAMDVKSQKGLLTAKAEFVVGTNTTTGGKP